MCVAQLATLCKCYISHHERWRLNSYVVVCPVLQMCCFARAYDGAELTRSSMLWRAIIAGLCVNEEKPRPHWNERLTSSSIVTLRWQFFWKNMTIFAIMMPGVASMFLKLHSLNATAVLNCTCIRTNIICHNWHALDGRSLAFQQILTNELLTAWHPHMKRFVATISQHALFQTLRDILKRAKPSSVLLLQPTADQAGIVKETGS